MAVIAMRGMEFYAYHGCFQEEQIIGTRFLVDVSIKADTSLADRTDDLSQTINYQSVYDVIKREMEIKSNILENVAYRIWHAIVSEFDVIHVSVEVKKLNPPLGGMIESVSVKYAKTIRTTKITKTTGSR